MSPSERRARKVARLNAEIEDRRRLLQTLEAEAAGSGLIDERQRSNRVVILASAGAIVIAAGTIVPAILLSRHSGSASAKPPQQASQAPVDAGARCPDFKPPPQRDVPVGQSYKFEDGGQLAQSFFNLYHPVGFSEGPLYTLHYLLFRKDDPRVRIRFGWRWPIEEADARRFFRTIQRSVRRSRGFQDLGTTGATIGCQNADRWSYERISNGERLRATRYSFVLTTRIGDHVAYDILFEAPATTYDRWRRPFDVVKRSFRVNPGLLSG
jgi:hypothetical protein